jgi:pimeloyl-ACP methyl ester carboxylesterase
VIERLDRPAVVAGHSLGGLAATAVAEPRLDLVRRLVLINSPPTTASRSTANAGLERVMELPLLGQLLWALASDDMLHRGTRSAVAPGAPVPAVLVEDVRATSHRAFVGSTLQFLSRFVVSWLSLLAGSSLARRSSHGSRRACIYN